jgi:hypothetical protein
MYVASLTLCELIERVGLSNVLHAPGKQVIGIDDVQGSRKFDSELVGELIFAFILARHGVWLSRLITPTARHTRVGKGQSDIGRTVAFTGTASIVLHIQL